MKRLSRREFFGQCREEPYRIFFPLGLVMGLAAVSLWPLYFSGIHKFYPGIMHARLMIEGFLAAFVIGFLGTAGPRLTSTARLSRGELVWLLSFYLAATGLQIGELTAWGDGAFLTLMVSFAAFMGSRFLRADELPPPGFVLVGLGLATAICGTALLLIGACGNPLCAPLGGILINQGFVLLLVLGVGSFLLPRFLDLPARPPAGAWGSNAARAGSCGIVILGTFAAEVCGIPPRWAAFARFAAALIYMGSQIPLHRGAMPRATLPQCLRLAMVLLLAGMLCQVIWPEQRLASLHVVFIGGFSLITLTVATRVVLGHGGFSHLFGGLLAPVLGMALLLVPAMALRFLGDFATASRPAMLSAAALLWIAGAALWAWFVLPKTLLVEPEEKTTGDCAGG